MAKKDFNSIKNVDKSADVTKSKPTGKGRTVGGDIAQATSKKGKQSVASEKEIEERKAEMRTQGRKGCKAQRINMAFSPDNYYFLKIMSKYTGKTVTEFTNKLIKNYQKEHPELMEIVQPMIEKSAMIDAMFNDED